MRTDLRPATATPHGPTWTRAVFWLLGAMATLGSAAQGDKQLRARADALFAEERYAEALSLYSQLVSLAPGDRQLNYRFGTCVLHGGGDREKAIGFLKYAVDDPAIPAPA